MSLFKPSRDEVRSFFFEAWRKFLTQQALTDLEKMAVQVMQLHPEYHAVLNQPELYMQQAYFPELGETNPFLHMSLHLSILEQISINQPIGIASIYQRLCTLHQNEHEAQHDILDCLAETIWHAQRHQTTLDNNMYLQLLAKKAGLQPPGGHG
ncbi:MAG TPA: DUF1841 family protein [Methylophilus sp.]|nr:DUF1841 family protein [Methylophilus sp.]HQQ34150.1 DUF1841 family protein [Methylophilus sp.]